MERTREIAKVVTKLPIDDVKTDFAYWQTRSCQERLEALEQIRREYNIWKYNVEPRLQRVYRIVKR